jgi:predicted aspartyl protease
MAQGNFEAAAAAFERVLRVRPADVDANLGAAQLALYRGDYQAASRHATIAKSSDPRNARAENLLAIIARHARDVSGSYQVEFHTPLADVPLLAIDPLPTLAVTINGHDARVVLDTGAPGLSVSADFAAKAGIRTTDSREATFAGNQHARVGTGGSVDALVIGSVTVRTIPTDVAPMPDPSIDGVLGTGLFAHFIATIDYQRGRLVLRPRTDSRRVERAAAAAGESIVPMYLIADHFLFTTASVNRAPAALFTIDTGGPMIGIDVPLASLRDYGITPDTAHPMMFGGGGGGVRAVPFTAASVSLGSTTVRDVPGIAMPERAARQPFPFAVAGRLSHEFFRHTRLTLDFAAMNVILATGPDGLSL